MTENNEDKPITAWFVGAIFSGEDQTDRFVRKGIWENGHNERFYDEVNSMEPGDLIAIKSSYTRKRNLPFGEQTSAVATMAIKVTGVIKSNKKDGKTVQVEWDEPFPTPKEWYFFTSRAAVWKITDSEEERVSWRRKNLIDFAFFDGEQKINDFLNEPYWKGRFINYNSDSFQWTYIYEQIAKALLNYKDNRQQLLEEINDVFSELNMRNPLTVLNDQGQTELLDDVCPFTVFGLFNKGITDANRLKIIEGMLKILEIDESPPPGFDGIPVLNNINSWFFRFKEKRQEKDIDHLWDLFECAIDLAENQDDEMREEFIKLFNQVTLQSGAKWNITFGLYWIKPWDFVTLDQNTKDILVRHLDMEVPVKKGNKIISGEDYLDLIDSLQTAFEDPEIPVNSFPDLSLKAWMGTFEETDPAVEPADSSERNVERYTKDDFLNDVFISEEAYQTMASLLNRKKNMIIQGAPGVGKTFAAKRLAYSLMGEKDQSRIMMIQFHQSYSYEDFIMGYRPAAEGFVLKEGPFYQFCKMASEDSGQDYFFIIDEINRGNLSKIFGELLMLIEGDKRGEQLTLTYSNQAFSVPENVYLIGMMNTADRSLAIIDYALRRRFSFYELEPAFESEGFENHLMKRGADEDLVRQIQLKIGNLNHQIMGDPNLGKGFRIGHSYFTDFSSEENWYEEIIQYEIAPLIREYWFDEEEKAEQFIRELKR